MNLCMSFLNWASLSLSNLYSSARRAICYPIIFFPEILSFAISYKVWRSSSHFISLYLLSLSCSMLLRVMSSPIDWSSWRISPNLRLDFIGDSTDIFDGEFCSISNELFKLFSVVKIFGGLYTSVYFLAPLEVWIGFKFLGLIKPA